MRLSSWEPAVRLFCTKGKRQNKKKHKYCVEQQHGVTIESCKRHSDGKTPQAFLISLICASSQDVSVPKMLSEERGDEACQKLKPIKRTSACVKETRHTAGTYKPQCKEDSFFSMTTLSSFHYFCDKNRFILWHSN